jgi:predicted acyl esterase
VFITMPDGVGLASTVYLPETEPPWPALLEALPYRKDDLSSGAGTYRRLRDEGDYAVCRVDLRGTGTSEGVAAGEYLPQEQDDLCEVIDWLSRQAWCTGSVGMFGTSYSGFNTIQTAMRRPPALKAIVPIYATDDRYTDDIHFGGGIRKVIEFGYPLFMVSENALPPVPALAGDGWRQAWLERIDEVVPWFGQIGEQDDGPFWRQGSLRPNYDLIEVPTMVVAGWADVYRNAALRMIEHLQVPKRLLMGPWCHMSPSRSIPGPRIDLVPEMLRWWDRWLRGEMNGVDEEPPIAVFIQRSTRPEPDLSEMPGEWRFEAGWPPERLQESTRSLADADRHAGRAGMAEETLVVRGDVGTTAHIRGSYDPPYGLPIDQRPDDAYSLLYEWPVEEELEILGNPRLEVTLRSSSPVAFLSAKLSEVLADGTSVLVSRGILNLTHRESHSSPEPLVGNDLYSVSLEMDATSRVFEAGNRMRLAIAGADWPNAWAPPRVSVLTIVPARTRLVLPVMVGAPADGRRPSFVPAPAQPVATAEMADEDPVWRIEHDVYARETRVVVHQLSRAEAPGRCTWGRTEDVRAGVDPLAPGTAWVESIDETEIAWPEVTARAKARLELKSDATTYFLDLVLQVYEDNELLRERRWRSETPRHLQ